MAEPEVNPDGSPKLKEQAQAYYSDTKLPISEEYLPKAIAEGKARFEKGARVRVVSPTGQVGTVAADEINQAQASGFRIELPSEIKDREEERVYGTLGQQIQTGAERALGTATFGLSDVIASELDPELGRRMAARERRNPFFGTVGSAIGLVTPGGAGKLITGAGNIVARGTKLGLSSLGVEGASLGARALRGGLSLGTAGAAEGGLVGLGQAVSESALQGTELTAERIGSHVAQGAIFGGVLGAGLGTVAPFAKTGLERVVGRARPALREIAEGSALKAAGAIQSDLKALRGRKLGPAGESQSLGVGRELLDYRFKTGERAGQKLFSRAPKPEDLAADISLAKQETGAAIGGIRKQIDEALVSNPALAELAPKGSEFMRRLDEDLFAALKDDKSVHARKLEKKLEQDLSHFRADPKTGQESISTFAELEAARVKLAERIYPKRVQGVAPPPPKTVELLEKAERTLDKYLDETAEKALAAMGEDVATYAKLQSEYSAFVKLEKISSKATARAQGNRFISPSDYATGVATALGSIMSGNIAALGYGAAGAVAHKILRERGRGFIARLADDLSKRDKLFEGAAKTLAGIEKPVRKTIRAAVPAENLFDRYRQASERVRELITNPVMAQQVITQQTAELAGSRPELVPAVNDHLLRVFSYLDSKRPEGFTRAGTSMTPMVEPVHVAPYLQRKFMTRVDTALDPDEAVQEIANGTLDRDSLETLEELYPMRFEELKKLVVRYVAERGEALPFQRRNYLSLVFGFPADWSHMHVMEIQATVSQVSAPAEEPPPPPRGGINTQKVTDTITTPSQKAAIGG